MNTVEDLARLEQRLTSLEAAMGRLQQKLGMSAPVLNPAKQCAGNTKREGAFHGQTAALDAVPHDLVDAAMQAARESFVTTQVNASVKMDEYGEDYMDIHVTLHDESPESEAEKYSACVARWATFIPPHVGGRIHLSTSWKS